VAQTNCVPLTVKGVCLDPDRRVLLCRNDRGEWELPGGRPEEGESFQDCLIREVQEESGLHISVGRLVEAFPYEVIDGRWVNVIVYVCEMAGGLPPVAGDEHDCVVLFEARDLPRTRIASGYQHAIDACIGSHRS
jgi:ADP-ribose pyrophosphatase YjhB (NUDIX family)